MLCIKCKQRRANTGKFCRECYIITNQELQIRELEKQVVIRDAQVQVLRAGLR